MILDPIRPYLKAISTGLCIALLCGTYIAGCNHGENNKEQEVMEITVQRDALADANAAWADAAEEAEKQVKANKQFAKEQYDRANNLAKSIAANRGKSDNVIIKQQKQLDKAKENPTCEAVLKQHYCSAAPVYSLD